MSDHCTLYRGGLRPATLACGGKLPWAVSGCMDRDTLSALFRYCPQCGKPMKISDKEQPASPAKEQGK